MATGIRGSGAKIAADLRRAIQQGTHRPGDKLPEPKQLAADLGVHRNTIDFAYWTLADEGLVNRRSGRAGGTWVRIQPPQEDLHAALKGFHAVDPPRVARRVVSGPVARLLGVEDWTELDVAERVWLDTEERVAVLESRWGDVEDAVDWRKTVTARMPNPQEVEQLGLARGVPVLVHRAAGRSEETAAPVVIELRMSAARFEIRTGR